MKRLAMVMALVTAVAVGCGDDEPGGAGGSTEPPDTTSPDTTSPTTPSDTTPPDATLLEGDAVEIQAIDNSFQPETARIAAGTEVTFVNSGQNDHNVIPEDEDADWRVDTEDFTPGDEVSATFDEPGVYRYFCSIHGTIDAGMPGVLVVE